MGTHKALVPLGGRPCAAYVLDALDGAAGEVLVIGGVEGLDLAGRRRLPDARPGSGPLGGLETALAAAAYDVCLVVACDMPLVTPELLRHILDRMDRSLAAVPRAGGRLHPLCAAYSRACLPAVRARLDRGELSMMSFLEEIQPRIVSIDGAFPPGGEDPMLNMNAPADAVRAERALALRRSGPATGP
jgi:molybdopterin-guanine dinucleotide biosynthesis protein A